MDIQVVLVILLALLTVNLLVVGVYVVLVLKEFRETVKKANVVLDDVEAVTSTVSKTFSSPISTLIGVATAAFQGMRAVKSLGSISSLAGSDEEED
ncbi:MAG: hypothetical protein ACOZAO_01855 [Patescibacteria group bacterium]